MGVRTLGEKHETRLDGWSEKGQPDDASHSEQEDGGRRETDMGNEEIEKFYSWYENNTKKTVKYLSMQTRNLCGLGLFLSYLILCLLGYPSLFLHSSSWFFLPSSSVYQFYTHLFLITDTETLQCHHNFDLW